MRLRWKVMRTLLAVIMVASMVLPGMFLALRILYIAVIPNTELLETLMCNVIPIISIAVGLVFGWLTGGEYEG